MKAFAAMNNSDVVRNTSSSGGVFYELAKWTVQHGGVVFGAAFDCQWNVIHTHVEKCEGLNQFQGSKYVQSAVGDEYQKAKEYLDSERWVLFSGTPCQIAGLKGFLGKSYKKLITVDFICHGIPSPMVWRKYLDEISGGSEIIKVNFREKSEGWIRYSLRIDFADGSCHSQTQQDDLYIKGFLRNLYLRPSCYECCFKGVEREADITLGDYWGVWQDIPVMFDNKGTSLVLLHSELGLILWDGVKDAFTVCEVDQSMALAHNECALKSVQCPEKRNIFFSGNVGDFDRLKRLTTPSLSQCIKQKAKRMVRKLIDG